MWFYLKKRGESGWIAFGTKNDRFKSESPTMLATLIEAHLAPLIESHVAKDHF